MKRFAIINMTILLAISSTILIAQEEKEKKESDPYFQVSPASEISKDDISNWNEVVKKHKHYIGEIYGGGIVFWVSPDGQHGLIASLHDLGEGVGSKWGYIQKGVPGAGSHYDGEKNTKAIYSASSNSGFAASKCINYRGGGFDDWYLPSSREMLLLAQQAWVINKVLSEDDDDKTYGFDIPENQFGKYGKYWTSTHHDGNGAWVFVFAKNSFEVQRKDHNTKFRAIRKF